MTQDTFEEFTNPLHPFYELYKLPPGERLVLATSTGTLPQTLSLLVEYECTTTIQKAIAGRYTCEPHILEALWDKNPSDSVVSVLACNDNTPIEVLCQIVEQKEISTSKQILMFNSSFQKDEEGRIASLFVYSESWEARSFIAGNLDFNKKTNHVFIQPLSQDPYQGVFGELIKNESLPANIIEELFDITKINTHEFFILNHSTPTHIIEKIIEVDPNNTTTVYKNDFYSNPNSPSQLIHQYALDSIQHSDKSTSSSPQTVIAKHPNTNEETLVLLLENMLKSKAIVSNFSWAVYIGIMNNKNFGIKNYMTEAEHIKTLSNEGHLREDIFQKFHETILKSPFCPEEWLQESATHPLYSQSVATNPKTPPHILENIVDAGHANTLHYIAEHPNTPQHVLEGLITNKNTRILSALVDNPILDESFYAKVMESGNDKAQQAFLISNKNEEVLIKYLPYLIKEVAEEYVLTSYTYSRKCKIQVAKQFGFNFPNDLLIKHVFAEPTNEVNILTGEKLPTEIALEILKSIYSQDEWMSLPIIRR